MWHDMSYGTSIGYSSSELYSLWERTINDSLLILPVFTQDSLHRFFEREFEKLERILDRSQIVITHVGPDASKMPGKYQNDPVSTFFYFDGSSLLDRSYGKTWIFGHTHTHCDYVHDKGCRLINHSLGYPGENPRTKIRTVYL